jgi:hypothetical protein
MHCRHFTAARQPIAIIEEFDLEDDEQEPRITPIRADKKLMILSGSSGDEKEH